MANIFDLYVNGIVNGTSTDDLITILVANGATISSGDGNDVIIIGAAYNSTVDAGAGNDVVDVLYSSNSTFIGGAGNDLMVNISGSATMYGDAGNLTSPVPLNLFFNPASFTDQTVVFSAPDPNFGSDKMYGTMGNDYMSGDSGSITNLLTFYTASTTGGAHQSMLFELTNSPAHFGNDLMYGGAGNDRMDGDADVTAGFVLDPASTHGATAIASGVGSQATAIFYSDKNSFNFGSDTMYGGDGNDTINGDVSVDAHEVAFGVATATGGGTATSIFQTADELIAYGADVISGGNGDDIIFGDGRLNSHIALGGTASANGAGSVARIIDDVGIDVHDHVTRVPLRDVLANDTLSGDAGNDTIYGDTKSYYNEADGGTATALNGGTASSRYMVDGSVVSFGKDTISGGAGNDSLIGDSLSTELEVVAGTATGTGASVTVGFINFTQTMGDDTISGNDGNDRIIGDVLKYDLLDNVLSVSTVAGHIRVADHFNNSITFGNDTLSGGAGCDNFITAVELSTDNKLVAAGFDKILDFSKTDDTLTFVGTDKATLAAHTTITHSGCDSIINFDGGAGGLLTLTNLNISSLNDITTVFLPDASSLMGTFAG